MSSKNRKNIKIVLDYVDFIKQKERIKEFNKIFHLKFKMHN